MNGLEVVAFAVRDSKAEIWQKPFFARTIGEVVRELTSAVNDPQHDFCKFAEDFSLWRVGSFDPVSGELKGVVGEVVCQFVTLKREGGPRLAREA